MIELQRNEPAHRFLRQRVPRYRALMGGTQEYVEEDQEEVICRVERNQVSCNGNLANSHKFLGVGKVGC